VSGVCVNLFTFLESRYSTHPRY